MITTAVIRAWCLVNGAWAEREDPVMAVCDPGGGDVGAAVTNLGYEAWCRVGVGEPVPVSLALYSREAPPLQFLLQLEGNAGNVVEHVFAETLPDAMELLARWAPLARTGARACEAPAVDDTGRPGDGEGRPDGGPGRPGDGGGCPEGGSGRPGDGSVPAEEVPGRPGEDPGRPWNPGGDHPDHRRPAVGGRSPVPVDHGTPPDS